MMYENIIESLEKSPVVEKNGYNYFVHPLSNGVPATDPKMIDEIASWMIENGNFNCDLILAPESMGIPFAVAVSLKTGKPYSVIRKTATGLPGEIEIVQRTGYSKSAMFINGVHEGLRVAVIDDVISTGGTMSAIVSALNMAKAVVTDIVVAVSKDGGASHFIESPVKVKAMIDLKVENGTVHAKLTESSDSNGQDSPEQN